MLLSCEARCNGVFLYRVCLFTFLLRIPFINHKLQCGQCNQQKTIENFVFFFKCSLNENVVQLPNNNFLSFNENLSIKQSLVMINQYTTPLGTKGNTEKSFSIKLMHFHLIYISSKKNPSSYEEVL